MCELPWALANPYTTIPSELPSHLNIITNVDLSDLSTHFYFVSVHPTTSGGEKLVAFLDAVDTWILVSMVVSQIAFKNSDKLC